jgi:hypothetical protein
MISARQAALPGSHNRTFPNGFARTLLSARVASGRAVRIAGNAPRLHPMLYWGPNAIDSEASNECWSFRTDYPGRQWRLSSRGQRDRKTVQ